MRTLILALIAMTAVPAAAQNCTPFTDVPANDPFCSNIQWMYNRGVTLGCTASTYCPAEFVRRDQMAAFMNRLGNVVFQQGGNAFGATGVLGTTDARMLDIVAQGQRALRVQHVADGASASASVNLIGGHAANVVSRNCGNFPCLGGDPVRGSAIGGGGAALDPNRVTDSWSVVGGGLDNRAGNDNADHDDSAYAVVAGGTRNVAAGVAASIGGGWLNVITGDYSTIGGGVQNTANGQWSTIPGGQYNVTEGGNSFAAGTYARANAVGCFVWADWHLTNAVDCNTNNLFLARATGGFELRTNIALTTGCAIAAGGGSWSCSSSRALKDDFAFIDTRSILERVVAMPIATWRYRDETSRALHLGPTSEDFRAAFGLGHTDKEIGLVDGQGVALAAIQGLNAKLEARLAEQEGEIAQLKAAIAELLAKRNGKRYD